MKKLFQKSGALTMAFLMLFSTMSFAVNKHFCGEILVEQTIFENTKSCCAGMHDSPTDDSTEKNQCCNNKKVVVEGQDELKTAFQNFDFEQHFVVATFVYSYINLFENLPKQVVPFKDYSPPLLVYDIPVLDQTFLI
jgi:hypothetical protein